VERKTENNMLIELLEALITKSYPVMTTGYLKFKITKNCISYGVGLYLRKTEKITKRFIFIPRDKKVSL
jgi:hypothetical protein